MTTTYATGEISRVLPAIEAADVCGDLDLWDSTIADLNLALRDMAAARRDIDAFSLALDRIEASAVLRIEGPNTEARKARLTLELADDTRYTTALHDLRVARDRLADADRRVIVARERCRLYRAALALDAEA